MEFSVTHTGPLSEGNEAMLIELYHFASLYIASDPVKHQIPNVVVRDMKLFSLRTYKGHASDYLTIDPFADKDGNKLYFSDLTFARVDELFSIEIDVLRSITDMLHNHLLSLSIMQPGEF